MNALLDLLSDLIWAVRGQSKRSAAADWDDAVVRALELVVVEPSPSVLGEALRLDEGYELPVDIVVATYRRLMALGVRDARTVVCFARYLLLHGPQWDTEANSLLNDAEPAARAAGLWDAPHLGHHPVFFTDY